MHYQLEAMKKNEKDMVAAAKRDPEAFGKLFDAYYSEILRYLVRRTGDVMAAEDLASSTFFKAYQNIDKFVWRDVSFGAWLYKIATNDLRMYYRRNTGRQVSLDQLVEDKKIEIVSPISIEEEAMIAQEVIERDERFKDAVALMRSMPMKYQEVISLRYVEGKSIKEVAQIIGKKEGTVKSLLSRGVKKLGVLMQPKLDKGIVSSEGSFKEVIERNV